MGVKTPLKHPQEPNVTVNTVANSIQTDSINNTISHSFTLLSTLYKGISIRIDIMLVLYVDNRNMLKLLPHLAPTDQLN